jgi:hypothetical protein
MLKSRVVSAFPLCDQEVLCRNLHSVARSRVEAYRTENDIPVVLEGQPR